MAALVWSPDIASNLAAMDQDHKQLLALLCRLDEARQASAEPQTILQLLEELQKEIKEHFQWEESLMAKLRYRDTAEHRTQHRILIMLLDRFVQTYKTSPGQMTDENIGFLWNWFVEHIRRDDKPLALAALSEPDAKIATRPHGGEFARMVPNAS